MEPGPDARHVLAFVLGMVWKHCREDVKAGPDSHGVAGRLSWTRVRVGDSSSLSSLSQLSLTIVPSIPNPLEFERQGGPQVDHARGSCTAPV